MNEDLEGYSSHKVCAATGIKRTTLDVWVLRRYLHLSDGPGTGRERRFSFDEVVIIAIAAELVRLGVSVGIAAHAANYIPSLTAEGKKIPIDKDGCLLIVGQPPRSKPLEIESPQMMPRLVTWPDTPDQLQEILKDELSQSSTIVMADVSGIVRRTKQQLESSAPKKKGRPRKI